MLVAPYSPWKTWVNTACASMNTVLWCDSELLSLAVSGGPDLDFCNISLLIRSRSVLRSSGRSRPSVCECAMCPITLTMIR